MPGLIPLGTLCHAVNLLIFLEPPCNNLPPQMRSLTSEDAPARRLEISLNMATCLILGVEPRLLLGVETRLGAGLGVETRLPLTNLTRPGVETRLFLGVETRLGMKDLSMAVSTPCRWAIMLLLITLRTVMVILTEPWIVIGKWFLAWAARYS